MIKFLLAIIITEAITEVVVKSELFFPFRGYLFEKGKTDKIFNWFHSLIDCGYCFSVWVGLFISFLLFRESNFFIHSYIDWIFIGLVVHRLSNVFHFLIILLKKSLISLGLNFFVRISEIEATEIVTPINVGINILT